MSNKADKQFNELKLQASLCPGSDTGWEPPESYLHWTALHAAKDELRSVVSLALNSFQATERDHTLSVDGSATRSGS
jgi:hypothetical protein